MPDSVQMMKSVCRDARIPYGSGYRDEDTLLRMLDDELRSLALPQVLSATGDFLVRYLDVQVTPGRRAYRLPARAIRMKSLQLLNGTDKPVDLVEVDSDDAERFVGLNTHWYLEENAVTVLLDPNQGGTLRFRYYRLPSALVLPSQCFQLVSKTSDDVGVALWTFHTDGDPLPPTPARFDIVKGTQPYETAWDDGKTSSYNTSRNGSDLLFTFQPGAVLPPWEVGDWLCEAGMSPYPQLPIALHDCIATSTAARVCREMGEVDVAVLAQQQADKKWNQAIAALSPHSKGSKPMIPQW